MSVSSWLLKFPYAKLKFLLPLPLLLITFGLLGEQLTNQLLSRPYSTVNKLLADTQTLKVVISTNAIVTEVEIEQEKKFTQVEIETKNSGFKELRFKLPPTEKSQVKAAIAQKLGLSPKLENFQVGTQVKMQFAVNVVGILANIQKEQGVTLVEVKTADSVLKELELELPVTQLSQVKVAIAQELGLSSEEARMFVSYRVK